MAFMTIKEDLHKKRAHEMGTILLEINQCTKDFHENRCEPETRLPAVEEYCLQVEKCMLQDPMKVVQSSKMTAALIAEIINEFIDPLGFKAIGVFFLFFVTYFFLSFFLILLFEIVLFSLIEATETPKNMQNMNNHFLKTEETVSFKNFLICILL